MDIESFEKRKRDHIELSMKPENQATGFSGLDLVCLEHEALPDLNFGEISLNTSILGQKLKTPLYINSMTAGHKDAVGLNVIMAEACEARGWMMGVGSQRRQLTDPKQNTEWKTLRKKAPNAILIGNLGIAQVIETPLSDIERLVDSIQAQALFIHLNSLQECIQPEGTTDFKGSFNVIEKLSSKLSVPVIIKETGCGFSFKTLKRLKSTKIAAVDISGLGGTHWGRIEGDRAMAGSVHFQAAKTFQNWGISTVESVLNANKALGKKPTFELWASGGVRTGLDAAKLIAMGAKAIGLAKPALEKALIGQHSLIEWMSQVEYELKTAMFCTGSKDIKNLSQTNWSIRQRE